LRAALVVLATVRVAAADGAFTATAGGGLNVTTPFAELQVGRRLRPYFELYADYSYGAAISTYPFHTFGIGARTYFARWDRVELFHQALAAFGLGTGGHFQTIGDRVLGPFLTQGLGVAVNVARCWSIEMVVSTGDPVWLRSELAARYRF
jgi:hypothetical protein